MLCFSPFEQKASFNLFPQLLHFTAVFRVLLTETISEYSGDTVLAQVTRNVVAKSP